MPEPGRAEEIRHAERILESTLERFRSGEIKGFLLMTEDAAGQGDLKGYADGPLILKLLRPVLGTLERVLRQRSYEQAVEEAKARLRERFPQQGRVQ